MAVSGHDRKNIEEFFVAVSPWMAGYRPAFNFVALRDGESFVIVQARLYFNTGALPPPRHHFQTANVRSGVYPLADLGGDARAVVDRLIEGILPTPDGDLSFRARHDGSHGAAFMPYNPQDLQSQNRIHLLSLVGEEQTGLLRPQIDWELRAAPTPYDGLQELMLDHQVGSLRTDASSIEVIAFHVAAVDFSSSIFGTKARLSVLLSNGLAPEKVSLGYRIFAQGRVVARDRSAGGSMAWAGGPESQSGSLEIDVPEGAVLDCVASYDGQAQHHGWIADPSTAQNPRRAVYEAIDPKMEFLRELLTRTGRGKDARQFEVGVAWLTWMLGFSVIHLGGTQRAQDAADLIAITPAGHFGVVECTTGTLKSDNKLPLLIQRAATVRARLDASGSRHLRVLPVMATSLSREEVRADLDQAETLGVAVFTKEDLESGLDRTLVLPDAERIYAEAEQSLQGVQDRLGAQGSLALNN